MDDWLPLSRRKSALAELERTTIEKIGGVRSLVGRADLEWLRIPESVSLFRELAARSLVWDIVPVTDAQTEAILRLARTVPELRIVIDHLARPPGEQGVTALGASHRGTGRNARTTSPSKSPCALMP